ncbi:MAG: hypothetical protein S4CHLAM2_12900 [Chlamydiales bacterium]|nr:hypothetical protein [Chlamydiales bacterium]
MSSTSGVTERPAGQLADLSDARPLKKDARGVGIVTAVALVVFLGFVAFIGGSTLLAFAATPLEYAGGLTLMLLGAASLSVCGLCR